MPIIVGAGVCEITFWHEGFLQPSPWAFIIERDYTVSINGNDTCYLNLGAGPPNLKI